MGHPPAESRRTDLAVANSPDCAALATPSAFPLVFSTNEPGMMSLTAAEVVPTPCRTPSPPPRAPPPAPCPLKSYPVPPPIPASSYPTSTFPAVGLSVECSSPTAWVPPPPLPHGSMPAPPPGSIPLPLEYLGGMAPPPPAFMPMHQHPGYPSSPHPMMPYDYDPCAGAVMAPPTPQPQGQPLPPGPGRCPVEADAGAPAAFPAPPAPPAPPLMLKAQTVGIDFEFELTHEDVMEVFGRYGPVQEVIVAEDGTSATVLFGCYVAAGAALCHLNDKPLDGISGARLLVEAVPLEIKDTAAHIQHQNQPQLELQLELQHQQHHGGGYASDPAAPAAGSYHYYYPAPPPLPSMMLQPVPGPAPPPVVPGCLQSPPPQPWLDPYGAPHPHHAEAAYWGDVPPPPPPPPPCGAQEGAGQTPVTAAPSVPKYTCKLGVGIENDRDFRVGTRVIQMARQIWEGIPAFQAYGGKTRLRGRGVGGPHEADEPLQLCISVTHDQRCFDEACAFAELEIRKIHAQYEEHCQQNGLPAPVDLDIVILDKRVHCIDPNAPPRPAGNNMEENPVQPMLRGSRPEGAPEEAEVDRMLEQRNDARKAGNYKRSDEIRDWLRARQVVVMDEKGAKGNCKGAQVSRWRYWQP